MAQSAVDACNSALQRVGAAAILSLADNSPEARECSRAYDSTRRTEMRRYPWNFALKQVTLAPDATVPDHDYADQFTLPTDCLRVIRPNDPQLDWKIEGRKILTNRGNILYLTYVADIEDVARWDSAFYEVFATALAIKLVDRLTTSNVKKSTLKDDYKAEVSAARLADAFESGPDEPPEDDWLVARL